MPKPIQYNLKNQKFNNLTAIEYIKGGNWKCLCECGKTVVRSAYALMHTPPKRCAHMSGGNYRDYNDKIYELIKEGYKFCSWCKEKKELKEFRLRKQSKSGYYSHCNKCCHEKDKKRSRTFKQKVQHLLNSTKSRCKKNKLEFDLDKEFILNGLKNGCSITGIPFFIDKSENSNPYSASIDRIDNTKGYIKSNCRMILMALNMFKGKGTDNDILYLAKKLLENENKLHLDLNNFDINIIENRKLFE